MPPHCVLRSLFSKRKNSMDILQTSEIPINKFTFKPQPHSKSIIPSYQHTHPFFIPLPFLDYNNLMNPYPSTSLNHNTIYPSDNISQHKSIHPTIILIKESIPFHLSILPPTNNNRSIPLLSRPYQPTNLPWSFNFHPNLSIFGNGSSINGWSLSFSLPGI